MIANVEFNNPKKGLISTYARYMMSPKVQAMPYDHDGHRAGNERLEAVWCNGLTQFDARKGQRSINKACRDFEEEMREWNKTWKQGQAIKDTSNQCVVGTISFGENDKITVADAMAKAQEVISNVMPGTRLTIITIHGDSNVLHAHFEAAVVDMETGKAYAPQGEYRAMYNQWELELERMELAYPDQLEHVKQREAVAIQQRKAGLEVTRAVKVKQLTHKTHQKLYKRGVDIEDVPEADMRSQFTEAYLESGQDFDALLDNLEARGIQVIPNMGIENVTGLTIAMAHDTTIRTGLGKFGDKYKWSNLSKDFNYDPQQHRDRLAWLKAEANTRRTNSVTTGTQVSSPLGQTGQLDSTDTRLPHAEANGPDTHTGPIGQTAPVESGRQGHAGRIDRSTPEIGQSTEPPDRSNKHTDSQGTDIDRPTTRETGPSNKGIEGATGSTTADNTSGRKHLGRGELPENNGHNVSDNGGVVHAGNVIPDDSSISIEHPTIGVVVQSHSSTDEEHQRRLQEARKALGDPPLTDEELEAMMEQPEGLVPADSTINNPHVNEFHFGDDDHKKALNTSIEI